MTGLNQNMCGGFDETGGQCGSAEYKAFVGPDKSDLDLIYKALLTHESSVKPYD